MTAQPIHHDPDPEDPAEILRVLPAKWHAQFLTEYHAAVADAARDVGRWRQLRELLHLWRLSAVAYSHPDFERAAQEARDARPEDLIPVPGWEPRR